MIKLNRQQCISEGRFLLYVEEDMKTIISYKETLVIDQIE